MSSTRNIPDFTNQACPPLVPANVRKLGCLTMNPSMSSSSQGLSALFAKNYTWPVGSTIIIAFYDGSDWQKAWVEKIVTEKLQPFVNLNFSFDKGVSPDHADISITFKGALAQSAVGRTSKNSHPSMYLGWVDAPTGESFTFKGATYNVPAGLRQNFKTGATVIHEFCHALGMLHEHQNPNKPIEWNYDAVWRMLCNPPNKWDWQKIKTNVIDTGFSPDELNGSEFDPKSIMLYSFGPELTLNFKDGLKANSELSDLDKEWLQKMYPSQGAVQWYCNNLQAGAACGMFKLSADQVGYASQEECKTACASTTPSVVTDPVTKDGVTTDSVTTPSVKWSCSGNECVVASDGIFATKEECEMYCPYSEYKPKGSCVECGTVDYECVGEKKCVGSPPPPLQCPCNTHLETTYISPCVNGSQTVYKDACINNQGEYVNPSFCVGPTMVTRTCAMPPQIRPLCKEDPSLVRCYNTYSNDIVDDSFCKGQTGEICGSWFSQSTVCKQTPLGGRKTVEWKCRSKDGRTASWCPIRNTETKEEECVVKTGPWTTTASRYCVGGKRAVFYDCLYDQCVDNGPKIYFTDC